MFTRAQTIKKVFNVSILTATLLCSGFVSAHQDAHQGGQLEQAIAGEHRSALNKARDEYRHPKETLEFFGFNPSMTVVEITPGGGWYTEILAPAVEHRLPEGADATKAKGYVSQSKTIEQAKMVGFTLAASSEINANAKDLAIYPKGVWTLPPVLALGDEDKAKYIAIGESDRMTLKFVK